MGLHNNTVNKQNMSLEKLHKRLSEAILKQGWKELTPLQESLLGAYKSGSNVAVMADDGAGKSASIAIHTLEKVKEQAPDDAPRAIILTDTIDNAAQLEILLNKLSVGTDLRIVLIHDKANQILQRNDLFDGCDILVGNLKRVNAMYLQNGFSVKHVKLLAIDNFDKLLTTSNYPHLLRLLESMPKVQKVIYRQQETARTEKFIDECLHNPMWIEN